MNAKIERFDRARALAIFAAVSACGSFSAAGRHLGLSPSAVGRTVDQIEGRLGVRLLLRSTRSLTLTAEGRSYLMAARRILHDLDDVERQLASQGAPRGRLRVSAALAFGRSCVVPMLGEFSERYPDILVDLALSDGTVDMAAGEADVAIRFGPLADETLTATRIGESRRIIVASPAYLARRGTPVSPEDLIDHNCLGFSFRRAEPVWPFKRNGKDVDLPIGGTIEANNGETLAELAMLGVGIARVGAFSVREPIRAGRLVPLLEDYNPGDVEAVHAVFIGGAGLPTRTRVFLDFMVPRLRKVLESFTER